MTEKTLVFVYGTLRTGCGNWKYYLKDTSEKVCDDKLFGFIMYNLGSFPAIVPVENICGDFFFTDIIGEVFEVTEETLRRLDGLEGYSKSGNGLYNRKKIVTENGLFAYVYFMNKPYRENLRVIESGDWLNQ